jgi:hypothetical protein
MWLLDHLVFLFAFNFSESSPSRSGDVQKIWTWRLAAHAIVLYRGPKFARTIISLSGQLARSKYVLF